MRKARRRGISRLVWLALALVILFPVARGLAYWPEVGDLAHHDPPSTAMIRQRAAEAASRGLRPRRYQRVVPYGAISPYLKAAVVAAEDEHFFEHYGVDLADLKEAVEMDIAQRRLATAGSSITQQLAKNLFLGTRRSVARKATELVIALQMEGRLPKARVLDLYLNNIEWGKGIYGCEAAARTYYGRSAARLTAEQAIRLASIIPNPRVNSPYGNSPRISERRREIAGSLYRRGYLNAASYRALSFSGHGLPGTDFGGWWHRFLCHFGRLRGRPGGSV